MALLTNVVQTDKTGGKILTLVAHGELRSFLSSEGFFTKCKNTMINLPSRHILHKKCSVHVKFVKPDRCDVGGGERGGSIYTSRPKC